MPKVSLLSMFAAVVFSFVGLQETGAAPPVPCLFYLIEGLLQVALDVVDMLNTHSQPQFAREHTGFFLLLGRQLLVGGCCRMDDEGFGVTHIRQVAYQF